ncbi:hypothetical protein [Kordia sp.]|uniref:hypothetical protein n=1 Tax=Kordia sp. TaxID=1965332 RepID=UPI0025C2E361|nr:hypothetical protein [Kordia sp.]MCH2194400.1 hypothetical protein [Kordia sp.]
MKKNIKKNVKDTGLQLVGGVAGVYGGNAIKALIPGKTNTIGNAVISLGGAAMSIFLGSGNEWYHQVGAAVGDGMVLSGVYGLINDAVTPSLPANDGSKKNKFIHTLFATGQEPTTSVTKRMGNPSGYRFTPRNRLKPSHSGRGMQLGNPMIGANSSGVKLVH